MDHRKLKNISKVELIMVFLGVIVTKSSIINYHVCESNMATEQGLGGRDWVQWRDKFAVAREVFVDMAKKLMLHS